MSNQGIPSFDIRMPDGSILRAKGYSCGSYPCIQTFWVREDETEELVCFAEYNPGHAGKEICVGAYSENNEETQYYESYCEQVYVDGVKAVYKPGTRIMLEEMDDPRPVAPGTMGTVDHVDDIGQIHCIFDDGRRLGLDVQSDLFHIVEGGTGNV